MPENFDHIIKEALDRLESRDLPDWDSFYQLWEAEAGLSGDNDSSGSEDLDDLVREDLAVWEYDADQPDWDSFEAALTAVENEEFDQEVQAALSEYEGLSYDEAYWEMFSYRLDALNNKPRVLLLRMVETAAIALVLLQLIQFYAGYKEQYGDGEFALTPYVHHLRDYLFKDRTTAENTYPLAETTNEKNNSPFSEAPAPVEFVPSEEVKPANDLFAADSERWPADEHRMEENVKSLPEVIAETSAIVKEERGMSVSSSDQRKISMLPPSDKVRISQKLEDKLSGPVLPVISAGETMGTAMQQPASDPLGYRSVNLLYTAESDSFMNSLPSVQAVKPRLHSAIEAGPLLDATTVVIQDGYFSYSSQPREEFTLNGGAFMRYKVGYKNVFGAIGMDYVRMKYSGLNQPNEVSMVTLPFELGYNVVNIPTFRMFVSGGVAGRFVPEASYSSDTYNQASVYGKLKSKEQMNGLLHSGPFEINSYLSGRMSIGFDFSVNKTMSVGFRYTHDYWLKGEGIGFNQDKFRSRHLALGTSIHF